MRAASFARWVTVLVISFFISGCGGGGSDAPPDPPPRVTTIILSTSASSSTLESLGDELSLSKERVRQLEAAAFAKMRKMLENQSKEVHEFFA